MNSAAKTLLCTLQGCPVYQYAGGRGEFIADADIDADGAPHAYHPDDTGLDALANAKDRAGRFVGILTDSHGRPIVQASGDPAPGYYISTTTYEDTDQPEATQRRYVDAERVPFIVVSPRIRRLARGIVLGCRARVTHTRTGRSVDAVVADIGPLRRIGELSIAAARAIGIPSSPRTGGESARIVRYEFWPGEAAPGFRLVPMR